MIRINVKADDELFRLIAEAADKANVSMNKYIVHLAAKDLKRPDLDFVPSLRMGRPRKHFPQAV